MGKALNCPGQRFGRLLIIRRADPPNGSSDPQAWRLCRCDCGNEKTIRGQSLRLGVSTSCGCFRREHLSVIRSTHGGSKWPEHYIWLAMKARCQNPNNQAYERYGRRGIKVCKQWTTSFSSFIEDMGRRPTAKHTIERIDNSKGYSPKNCRWATRAEQAKNRRSNRLVTIAGETRLFSEWCLHFGLNRSTAQSRLTYGWTEVDALTVPVRP